MKKRIVLCADDYGQAPAISQGILDLIQLGRLSATSCLVNASCWPEHGKWLIPYADKVDIGLHLNLTEGFPLSERYKNAHGPRHASLFTLLKMAYFRQLDPLAVEYECHAQLDRFEAVMGRPPDFIDGHQHVHQFPLIRQALVKTYERRLLAGLTYLRLPREKMSVWDLWYQPKKVIIFLCGTHALKRLLDKKKIPYNQTFAGIYNFHGGGDYRDIFSTFLTAIEEHGMIMCHPGLEGPGSEDPIAAARLKEYGYLSGSQFIKDCELAEIALVRFLK